MEQRRMCNPHKRTEVVYLAQTLVDIIDRVCELARCYCAHAINLIELLSIAGRINCERGRINKRTHDFRLDAIAKIRKCLPFFVGLDEVSSLEEELTAVEVGFRLLRSASV